jgi:hypothetical protein
MFRDYDTDNDVTDILGANAGVMNFLYTATGVSFPEGLPVFSGGHPDNPDISKYLYFAYELDLVDTPAPDVTHFYIGGLSVVGCEAVATNSDGSVIGTASQIDNFIYIKLSSIGGLSSIKVSITFPYLENNDGQEVRLSMYPPFFGGDDIAQDSGTCYVYGSQLRLGNELQFEQSNQQSFEINESTFMQKSVPIESANLDQLKRLIRFFRSDRRYLTLLVLEDGSDQDSFFYGPSNATTSTQNDGNLNTLDITTRNKFAGDYSL